METNPIPDKYHEEVTNKITDAVDWTEPGLRILRLRLLSDPGHPDWDVSYCHGKLPDGRYVDVTLPFPTLRKDRSIKYQLVTWARRERLYLKATGCFDAISTFC